MHNYLDVHGVLPPGFVQTPNVPDDGGHWAWNSFILPYIELGNIYNDFNVGNKTVLEVMANPATRSVMQRPQSLLKCPSDSNSPKVHVIDGYKVASGSTNYFLALTSYIASNNIALIRAQRPTNPQVGTTGALGAFFGNSNIKIRDISDGTSNTILVGERAYQFRGDFRTGAGTLYAVRDFNGKGPSHQNHPDGANWQEGWKTLSGSVLHPINTVGAWNAAESEAFSSHHDGGVHFVFADGAVRFISQNISAGTAAANGTIDQSGTLGRLVAIADGLPVGEF